MAFYNRNGQVYLEANVLGIDVGTSLLQARNEAPGNAALWTIAFAGKNLTSLKTFYSNIEEKW